jgi:signal transduction histidine kinase
LPLAEIPPPLALVRQLATRRFAAPVIIVCAALALLVNEVTYKNTRNALMVGRALTDARIAAAGMLQLLADAETGQRGYLLTGRREYLAPLDAARLEVPRLGATVSSFLEASGVDGHGASKQMAEDIRATLAEIEKTVEMERLGDHQGALNLVESGLGKLRMDDMRVIFGVSLVEAAVRQQDARISIDETLWINRVAVATLILLGATGLGLYVRHLRLYDRERKDLQDLLEAQVRERTAQLSELAGNLLTAREDEKAHLARELHDELGGMLTAAKLDMARMRARVADDPWMVERIKQVNLRLQEGIACSRRIVEDLRPSSLASLGLAITLLNLCADAGERLDIVILTDFDDVDLSPDGNLAVYRLIQEALTNVGKYAKASNVRVSLKLEPDVVRVRIQDDGVGFDQARSKPGSHGIPGMRFRIEQLKGTLSVTSSDGAGTCLDATLPSAPTLPHVALA